MLNHPLFFHPFCSRDLQYWRHITKKKYICIVIWLKCESYKFHLFQAKPNQIPMRSKQGYFVIHIKSQGIEQKKNYHSQTRILYHMLSKNKKQFNHKGKSWAKKTMLVIIVEIKTKSKNYKSINVILASFFYVQKGKKRKQCNMNYTLHVASPCS